MTAPPIPLNEAARLAALDRYQVLDTAPEQAYDDFTQLAARICGVPIALVSLIDKDRQWFKSKVGLEAPQTPREQAFCAHAIVDNQLLVVPDASHDPRFEGNPLVTGDPHIRFYAGAPLVTGEGHGLGTLCVIDRVPRQLSPEQLASLQALSRQLMAQLELRRTMELLIEAERAKKVFVANVSHELRTPLTSIRGALALVRDSEPDLSDDAGALLSAAHRNADRLLALVNDLLDLERVGSGELAVVKKECDLGEAIALAVDTVQPIARDAGVAITSTSTTVRLLADPERLTQVFINLLANAVRFSPKGSTVRVGVTATVESVHLTVDDHGPGVPPAFRQTIFEPFKQVEGSAAHKKGGTGLGLAISQAIVKEHGGVIEVGDAPGGGARFWFELPI
ncbi:MAG: GAF domain-containing sensor histidine kinase [Acidobacteriota bacterium]|nr:GAF domain-containing sensor histidine kinase [Acidobacteriota bacterium]